MSKLRKKTKTDTKKLTNPGFAKFLIQKNQIPDWIIIFGLSLAGYIVLKICYPYPIAISDSLGYIHAAELDKFYFYRPFGYSFFLRLIHSISGSIHAVFISQMIVYFISTSIFALTIKYFYRPASKLLWCIMLVVLTLSPMGFRLANCILSDLVYGAIIYLMLASFIFIIERKSWIALIFFVLLLFSSLHVRYSSMVFPVVFAVLFFMVKGKIRWVALVCIFFVTTVFYNQIKSSMKKTTNFNQFSTGFDGWQIANNGMHVLPFVELKLKDIKDPEVRELHEFVMENIDSVKKGTDYGKKVSSTFIWDKNMPLKLFLNKKIRETGRSYTNLWIKLGSTTYNDYGWLLVKKYPFKFFRYYFMLNARSIVYPISIGALNMEIPITSSKDTKWYNIPEDQNTDIKNPIYQKFLAKTTQILWAVSWIFILGVSALAIIFRKKIKFTPNEKKVFWAIFTFGVIYYASVVFASPVEIRYWFAMKCVNFACVYILLNKLLLIKGKKEISVNNG